MFNPPPGMEGMNPMMAMMNPMMMMMNPMMVCRPFLFPAVRIFFFSHFVAFVRIL